MMAGANNGNPDSDKNWKGSSKEAATEQVRYRWQMTSVEQERSKRDRSWQRLLIKSAAIVGVGCLLYFVYLFWVMRLPTRTPMLAISVSFYPEQFPPNLYAAEDLQSLSRLDGKNISLFQESSLSQFESGLKQLGEEVLRRGTVLISLNAHGAVNDAGEPCLIPASASPLESESWIPLKSVLETIANQSFAKTSPIVVFLDCQHQRFEPRMGILENRFFDVLESSELVENLQGVRLALISSASSGESTHSMHAEQSSVFGHYLHLAISGEADLAIEGANGDSKLTLDECYRYLKQRVADWTGRNRGTSQTVSLKYTKSFGNPDSVILAYTLRETVPPKAGNSESISADNRQALWNRYHKLDLANLRRIIPEQLSDLEERLLRLDQWSSAGMAYREPVRSLATSLAHDLDRFEQTELAEWLSPLPIEVHSLPLAKQLNRRLASELAEWEQAFKARNPTRQSLSDLRDRWKNRADEFRPAEYHFLDLLLSDAPETLWAQSRLLSEALNATLEAHRVASVLEARRFQGLSERIAAADVIRRTADDRLFQEDPNLWLETEQSYQTARAEYRQILESAAERELAYQKCDEVDAALPYLVEWAEALPERRPLQGIESSSLTLLLGELAFQSRSLRQQLDSGNPVSPQTGDFSKAEKQIRTAIDNEVELLSSVQDLTLENFGAADALLRLPFLSGQTRRSLEITRDTILTDLRRRTKPRVRLPESEELVPRSRGVLFLTEKLPNELSGLGNLLSKWNDSEQTPQWERKIRAELQNRAEQSSKIEHENDRLAREFFAQRSSPVRQTTAWDRTGSVGNRFALRHQQFLATRELLNEADRTLKDFWGPASTRSQVFSLEAAETLLQSSKQLLTLPSDNRFDSVADHFQVNQSLVERGLLVDTNPEIVFHPQAPTEIDLWLTQPPSKTTATDNPSWPSGDWTAFLSRADGQVVSSPVLIPGIDPGLELSEASRTQLTLAPSAGILDDRYRGVFYFRGHRFEAPLDLRFVRGPSVSRELEPQSPTQVTVSGSYGGPISFLFVLDCSYSMHRTVGPNGKTRLQVAAETLYRVLNSLRGEEKIHAGVLFYGHRVGWNQRDPDEILYQQEWPGEIPPNLLPLEDVELVLSPGPIDDTALKQLTAHISNVRPWGETPLYLSLVRAAELVDPQSGGETHIVAITDGANNQRVPKALILSDAQTQQIKSRDEVVTSATGVNAKIDLLGFEMDPEENQESRTAFLAISSQTGGAYYPAVSADALLSVLQEILGPSEFSVGDRSLRITEPVPFGQSVDFDLPDSLQEFAVTVDRTTERIQVHRGEQIRMYFDRKASNFFVKPSLRERIVNAPLTSRSEISVGFHSPRRVPDRETHVRFRCSLSADGDRFVSRPASVVVRVTALKSDGTESDQVWYVFNPLFVTEESVPVIEFVAEDWPRDITRAKVEFWASWETIEPEVSRPLDEFLKSTEKEAFPMLDRPILARRSPEQNGTYFLIEKLRENTAIDNPFLMDIVSNDRPDSLRWRVRHQFDRVRGVHLQEMIPESLSPELPADLADLNVELRSFKGIIKHSLTTSEPAELDVLPAGTILQPTSR